MSTPVWTWLPGSTEPVRAGTIDHDAHGGKFVYESAYRDMKGARALDPVHLRLGASPSGMRFPGVPGLPGVIMDAAPAGYGQDRLESRYRRTLSPLELLELGPGDAIGALAVCQKIEAKMDWRPHRLADLTDQIARLEEDAPASRAIKVMNDEESTGAGGERPKVTLEADGSLWLAKLQDRGDAPHLPAREHAVMEIARDLGITVPRTRLHHHGPHEVFLIERFDRSGDPKRPYRLPFASAHTVLGLKGNPMPGDPSRSYLVLADRMRRWIPEESDLAADLAELWRRMCFNALVGNKDDHPRNHGLLHDGESWRLSPAYDITPLPTFVGLLAMGVQTDGGQACSPQSLLAAAVHFGVEMHDAVTWLDDAANHVADHWQQSFRESQVPDARLRQFEPAFVIAEEIASAPGMLESIAHEIEARSRRGRRRHLK